MPLPRGYSMTMSLFLTSNQTVLMTVQTIFSQCHNWTVIKPYKRKLKQSISVSQRMVEKLLQFRRLSNKAESIPHSKLLATKASWPGVFFHCVSQFWFLVILSKLWKFVIWNLLYCLPKNEQAVFALECGSFSLLLQNNRSRSPSRVFDPCWYWDHPRLSYLLS